MIGNGQNKNKQAKEVYNVTHLQSFLILLIKEFRNDR